MGRFKIELDIDDELLEEAERFVAARDATIEAMAIDLVRTLGVDRTAAEEAQARLDNIFDTAAEFQGRPKSFRDRFYRR